MSAVTTRRGSCPCGSECSPSIVTLSTEPPTPSRTPTPSASRSFPNEPLIEAAAACKNDLQGRPAVDDGLFDVDRVAAVARHFLASYDEFGSDPQVMGFEVACLEAALAREPAPRDEDPPR
jgi:hypothetical protein